MYLKKFGYGYMIIQEGGPNLLLFGYWGIKHLMDMPLPIFQKINVKTQISVFKQKQVRQKILEEIFKIFGIFSYKPLKIQRGGSLAMRLKKQEINTMKFWGPTDIVFGFGSKNGHTFTISHDKL